MKDNDMRPSTPNVRDVRYWERLVQEGQHVGDVVQHDPDSPFDELRQHNTVLHLVVLGFYSLADQSTVVSLLLDNGASPNTTNDNGETPLHMVCQLTMRDPEIVRLLLKHGGDPRMTTNDGKRPVDFLGKYDRYSEEIRSLLGESAS